ncbi:MAG: 50S ribosomal protein L9 [Alphaproteobacteria bacterium]|jgi:large subunit ribosomal protein L9|nr:50S ribosomal protein L9 [Alphaproteobacteria bacterium]
MDVILLERVEKLGQMGEIVKVRPGYARNFLIPQGKALRATKTAKEAFEQRRAQLEAQNLERKRDAEAMKARIEGQSVVLIRQASEMKQLYGSVSARDIAEAFSSDGVTLDRRQVRIDHPIKTLGIYDVRVALHPEVDTTLRVNVARSPEEADVQAGKAAPRSEEPEEEPEVLEDESGDLADIIEQELAEAERR